MQARSPTTVPKLHKIILETIGRGTRTMSSLLALSLVSTFQKRVTRALAQPWAWLPPPARTPWARACPHLAAVHRALHCRTTSALDARNRADRPRRAVLLIVLRFLGPGIGDTFCCPRLSIQLGSSVTRRIAPGSPLPASTPPTRKLHSSPITPFPQFALQDRPDKYAPQVYAAAQNVTRAKT